MSEAPATSERLDAVFRAAICHSIVLTDTAGLITMFSEGAELLLGYPAAEIVGLQTPDLFFAPGQLAAAAAEFDVRASYADVVAAALVSTHWTRDWHWLTSAGKPIIVRLAVTAVLDADGRTEAYLSIGTDVTAEVEAGAEFQAAETRWRTLLELLPGTTVLVIDEFLRYQTAIGSTPTASLELASVIGKTVHEVTTVADAEQIQALASAALGGVQRSAEVKLSTGTFTVVAMPLTNHRGRPEALIFITDVTAEREREQTIRTAQQRFQRLFNEAPNGTALVSLTGTFIQVNPMMCRLLARSGEELVGQSVASIAAAADDETEIKRYFNDLLSAPDGHLTQDWTVRRGDRQLTYLSASGAVLTDEAGRAELILVNLLDISQRRKIEQRLAHLADHDPLTGLANRRRFHEELTAHLDRCRRYGARGALMVLDLDHFKDVNDTMGHAAGDQLIVATADALRHRLRTSDVVARMGGDEFAVLLPNVDHDAAERVAASVVQLIREEVQIFDDSAPRSVTTSVGVVLIDKTDVTTSELMDAADMTMYEAKEAGRNGYAIFEGGRRSAKPVPATPSWVDRIAAALSEQHLLLYAQPILNLRTQRYEGAELFVRMLYEGNELILPDRFLYVAERVGLMPSIDLWVVSEALSWLRRLGPSAPAFQLHVNISPVSMSDEDALDRIQERVMNSGVDASRLVFEVKEAAAASRLEAARSFTERVRDLGAQLALDDFGAGFGSFYYLKHLHFDAVKISGELLTKSVLNRTDQLILESVLELAKRLGKKTIAQAVEDAAMLEAATAQGIDASQGYYLSRPQPVENLLSSFVR